MNFVEFLPAEITEKILLYLSDVDMIHFSWVCTSFNSFLKNDMMWKRFCVRKGLDEGSKNRFTRETGEELWKNYYWTMKNFEKVNYTTHTFRVNSNDNEHNFNYVNKSVLNCMNFIVPSTNYLSIWDLKAIPRLNQLLPTLTYKPNATAITLKSDGNYFLQISDCIVQVFEKNPNNFYRTKKVLVFRMIERSDYESDKDLFYEYNSREEALHVVDHCMASDKQLVIGFKDDVLSVYQGEMILTWKVDTWERYPAVSLKSIDMVKKIEIESPWIYVMIDHDNKYRIKVYDLIERKWLLEVLQNEPSGSFYSWNFSVGSIYMVSCVGIYSPNMLFMKIWKKNTDKVVSTIQLSPMCQFDCIFDEENIIFTSSMNRISVWNPLKEEKPLKNFIVNDRVFTPIKLIWDDLIFLQGTRTFEVLNWKTSRKFQLRLATEICANVEPKVNGSLVVHSIDRMCELSFGEDLLNKDCVFKMPRKLQVYNFSNRFLI